MIREQMNNNGKHLLSMCQTLFYVFFVYLLIISEKVLTLKGLIVKLNDKGY